MRDIDENYTKQRTLIISLKNQLELEQSMYTQLEWNNFIQAEDKVLNALASVSETKKECATRIRDYSLGLLNKSSEEIAQSNPERTIFRIKDCFKILLQNKSKLLEIATKNYTAIANKLAAKKDNKPVHTETSQFSEFAEQQRNNHFAATPLNSRAQTDNASFMLKHMSKPSKMNVVLIFFGVLFLASGAACIGTGLEISAGACLLAVGLFAVGVGYKNHSDNLSSMQRLA